MRSLTLAAAIFVLAWSTVGSADPGFDERHKRNYNIFNPANQFQHNNPLSPANAFDFQQSVQSREPDQPISGGGR